jgi:hypothetical protein
MHRSALTHELALHGVCVTLLASVTGCYAGTKAAVPAIQTVLGRKPATRCGSLSSRLVYGNEFCLQNINAEMKAQLERSRDSLAMKPETIEQASHCYRYENALGDCGKPPLLL